MKLEVLPGPAEAAQRAAVRIAEAARAAVAERGSALVAVSGGTTAPPMLRALAGLALPWERLHLFQVDERAVPAGDPRRNLGTLRAALGARAGELGDRLHAMPVEAPDLEAGAAAYAETLERVAGAPAVLDLVQLGLGADGHTASLVPGDPILRRGDADVAATAGEYAGTRRLSLTLPALARARGVLWLVTGAAKAPALARLLAGDASIPAGRVLRERATVVADLAAAGDVRREVERLRQGGAGA